MQPPVLILEKLKEVGNGPGRGVSAPHIGLVYASSEMGSRDGSDLILPPASTQCKIPSSMSRRKMKSSSGPYVRLMTRGGTCS